MKKVIEIVIRPVENGWAILVWKDSDNKDMRECENFVYGDYVDLLAAVNRFLMT